MIPRVAHATLDNCAGATGTVVVIDVLRAFTTAAVAFERGAEDIVVVSGVQEALDMRLHFPGSLIVGEVGGLPVPGFDFNNSPAAMERADVSGRRLIQRTSSGTQGVVLCEAADTVMVASFVCAGATLRALRASRCEEVTFVSTGVSTGAGPSRGGDEDVACAEYMAAHLVGDAVSVEPYLERVRKSDAAKPFFDAAQPDFDPQDVELCAELNRYDFAMTIMRQAGLFLLQARSA